MDSAEHERPPRQLLAAVAAWWAAAVLTAVQVAAMWTDRDVLVGGLVAQGASPQEAESRAQQVMALNTAVDAFLVLLYFAMSLLIYRRRPWARNVLTAFGLVHVIMTMAVGVSNLLLLGLLVLALVLTWWPTSGKWIAGEHG